MSGPPLLVEREDERRALGRAVSAAAAGAGSLVVVDGSPGIGKSAVLGMLSSLGAQQGMHVLVARAGEFESDFAYGVVRTLLEREVAGLDPDARAAAGAGPAAQALRLLADLGGDAIGPQAVLHGIYWLIANLAASRPLALVVDDAHWCDEESMLALSYVARRRDGLRLAIALARRPEAGGAPALAELAADPGRVALRPRPLTPDGVRDCLTVAVGRAVEEDLVERAHAVTGGNPLLVAELGREIGRTGAPRAEDAFAAESLGQVFRERIRRLGVESARAAGALAVLGDDADHGMLAEVTGMTEAELERTLARLRVEGLVGAGLSFAHPLARAAVRREIGPVERRRVAVSACRLLRARGAPPERATALVVALVPAGDPEIVEVLRGAAAAAMARGAPLAAVAALERALAEPPPEADRAAVLLELGVAARRAEMNSAIGHLYGALEGAGDPRVAAAAAVELARALGAAGRRGEAVGVLRRALSGGPDGLRQPLRGALASLAAEDGEAAGIGDPSDVDEAAPGAAALLAAAAYAIAREGRDRAGALALAHRAARRAMDEDDLVAGLRAVRVMLAGGDDALAAANGLAAAAARLASSEARAAAHLARGEALLAAGMPRDAEADLLDAVAVAAAAGLADLEHHATTALVDVMVVRAAAPAARAALGAVPGQAPSADADLLRRLARARLALAERDPAVALREALSCAEQHAQVPILSPALLPWRGVAAHAALALGDLARAAELAAEEVALAEAWGAPGPRCRALLTLAIADGSATAFEAALVAAHEAGPLDRARALLARGSALRRAGERSDGRVALSSAYAIAEALGADAVTAAAAAELEASGQPRRAEGSDPVAALTASERRVAVLAADGASNREIAQTLFVTAKTVETHLSRVFRKLGVSRRAELAELLGERPARIAIYS